MDLKSLKHPAIFSSYLQQPTLFFPLIFFFFFLLLFNLKVFSSFERLRISLQLFKASEFHCIELSPIVAENDCHLAALGRAALWHIWWPLQLPQLFQEVPCHPLPAFWGRSVPSGMAQEWGCFWVRDEICFTVVLKKLPLHPAGK